MKQHILLLLIAVSIFSCQNRDGSLPPIEEQDHPRTAVRVAYPSDTAQVQNNITLNATASYLLKSDVKANSNGYITRVAIKVADPVVKGAVLFGLQTKEARALGNTINKLDPSFRFNGATTVVSPATGYVAMLNHQMGDYVQDGEVLATITDANSFGFVVDVPYEYLQVIKNKKVLLITLPDGNIIKGSIGKIMPSVDAVSQTVKVLLSVTEKSIPENLIGTVSFSKSTAFGLSVPKMAVLSDEVQSSFWVMKMINDTTAVKIPITKGIETDQYVQIKSGKLTTQDRVLTSGNFGLSDTASVSIQKP